jgi:hypothetical protein
MVRTPAWTAAVGLAFAAAATVILSGCDSSGSLSVSCAVGTERCACTAVGTCDPGLTCLSMTCARTGLALDSGTQGTPDAFTPTPPDGGSTPNDLVDAGADAPAKRDQADLEGDGQSNVIPAPPDAAGLDGEPVPCPPGTEATGAACAGAGPLQFAVRVGAEQLPADGYSRVPVLVLATAADGSAATVRVRLSLTRAGAGVFDREELDVGPVGGPTYFVPCSSAIPGCLGKVRIQVALASAPATIVATSAEIDLVAPTGVGSPAACLTGGNVMVFDGNDYIYQGLLTVTNAVFTASSSNAFELQISVEPRDSNQGSNWRLWFSSKQLQQPLREQVYREAERAPFASPGHPGIDIGGSGRGCNTIKGSFEIHKLVFAGNQLKEVTVVFDQHCEGGTSSVRGCIHLEP